jgi:hypothetical protein
MKYLMRYGPGRQLAVRMRYLSGSLPAQHPRSNNVGDGISSPAADYHPPGNLSMKTDTEFAERFSGSPIKRAKRTGLQRNARVVQENQKIRG